MIKKMNTTGKKEISADEQKLIRGGYETECSKVCGTPPYTAVSYKKYTP